MSNKDIPALGGFAVLVGEGSVQTIRKQIHTVRKHQMTANAMTT